jgi:RecA/RadA recombinase
MANKNKDHSALLERLRKNSRVQESTVLSESTFFGDKEFVRTAVPMMNVALSGDIDGGLASGLTMIAGPSKHFKSMMSLMMVAAYMKKYPEAVCIFYDSEFGSPKSYFDSFGIDTTRIIHTPIINIENLKFDLINQLEEVKRGDKLIIFIDSLGNVASKKELEDAINQKSVADMSRAKAMKGLFRMVTPYLTIKDIPLIAVNHTYETMDLFPKQVVSGGTGATYASNAVWIIGRRQDKDSEGIQGYHFIINIEKSRFVREKSKIPISVSYKGGIEINSGLLDVALEGGYATKPSQGWYQLVNPKTGQELSGKLRIAQTNDSAVWEKVYAETDFKEYVRNRFQLGRIKMVTDSPDRESIVIDSEDE